MGRRFLLAGLWIAGWVAWPGALALAAEGEGVDLEAVIQELRAENPELSESEARELAGLAVQDVREGEGAARDLSAGATEQAGIIVTGPGNLGAPELGGGPGSEMTPEEHALAEKVGARAEQLKAEGLSEKEIDAVLRGEFEKEFKQFEGKAGHEGGPGERDDAKLKDLYERGVPGIEHAPGLEHREGLELNYREFPEGRPDLGHEPTSQEREQMERYREETEHFREMERELGPRDTSGGHEMERPTPESREPERYAPEYTPPEPR